MLQKLREKMKSTQRGAIMVFFAILVPLFLGMIGFAIDAGFLYMQKAKLQDIADAAALAGAGHLNDGDDGSKTRLAVRKFAEENGVAGTATSEVFIYDEDYPINDNINLGTSDKLKLAMKIEHGVMDKDNVQRDHIRVAIAKRVPTFFIRFLFPDEKEVKEVIVRSVAVAEYVKGEAPVAYDGARIFGGQLEQDYSSANSIVLENGTDFSMFAGSGINNDKVPFGSVGTFYGPEWQPKLPEGWTSVKMKTDWHDWDSKEEKEAYEKMISLLDKKIQQYSNESSKYISEKSKYINKEGNKRYIGFDSSVGKIIDNISDGDDNIELYMDGTFADINNNQYTVVLTNGQLRGVKTVKKLVFGQETQWGTSSYKINIIATEGINYGDIYDSPVGSRVSLSGKRNHFNGLIYSPSQIWVGGEDNYFNETGKTELFACHHNGYQTYDGIVKIGLWDKALESTDTNGNIKIEVNWQIYETNNSSWHMYWGNGTGSSGSSSSSGSSGSDTATKSRVRLVI